MTRLAILATFRTAEGFAVIKSELVDRISVQNPHLYRQDAEKIVNTIFSEIPPQWRAVIGSNCGDLEFFLQGSGKAGLDEILAQGLWFRSKARPFRSSGAARK